MSRTSATFHGRYFNAEDEAIAHELRSAQVHIDLDAFLALTSDERARRWRSFDAGTKQQLVCLAIERQTGRDWEPSEVAAGIAHYDARYGDGPLASEAAVCAALERLAAEHQRSFERAGTKGERSFFTRWAGAFRKALLYYHQGIRPEPLASGAWLVASATRGGVVHQVDRSNHCTCEARDKGCWHAALALGIEVAHDDMERFDGGDEELPAKDAKDEDADALRAPSRAFAGNPIGAYLRGQILDTMLDRSAATIAALAETAPAPTPQPQPAIVPHSPEYYAAICERRQAAGLDICGRPQDAPSRPLRMFAERDAEDARRRALAEERAAAALGRRLALARSKLLMDEALHAA